jgi:hypothetical protein
MKIARLRIKNLHELVRQFENITIGLEGNLYVSLAKDSFMSTINRDLLGRTVLGHPSADGSQYILLCFIDGDRARNTVSAILYKEFVEIIMEGEI